jgi:cytosine/adenosine deaminase-related metal-dependent hydrolase
MQSLPSAGLTFINAQLAGGDIGSLRIVDSRIAAIREAPQAGDRIVDLEGDRVLPGLINAHDHLQLNSMPPLEFGRQYLNVRDWIADINARRRSDPSFEAQVAVARDERLLIGGVKNLLSGVTTVAHHDPLYPFLSNIDCPTGIVAEYGWSHSLYIDGEEKVRNAYARTPFQWPWIIHAAEGVDEEAAGEFERLDALGCIGSKTLLVHGVALTHAQRKRLAAAAAGLIWCPSSNLRLFGKTAQVGDLIARGRVALGTDSRLSGARDLLDELRLAGEVGSLDDPTLESLVTRDSARLLRLADRGSLQVGSRADILILPPRSRLSKTTRSDVRLVLRGGNVRYGDKDCAQAVAPTAYLTEVRVDGKPKILDSRIATLLSRSSLHEGGVELPDVAWRAA